MSKLFQVFGGLDGHTRTDKKCNPLWTSTPWQGQWDTGILLRSRVLNVETILNDA